MIQDVEKSNGRINTGERNNELFFIGYPSDVYNTSYYSILCKRGIEYQMTDSFLNHITESSNCQGIALNRKD
jgi:hypothetical protein